jgi:hypothetical protein
VPALRFGILSLIGTAIYVAALSCAGYAAGPAWDRVAGDLSVAGYVTAVVVVAALATFAIYRLRRLRRESREAAARSGQAVTPVRSGKSRSYPERSGATAAVTLLRHCG